MVRPIHFFVRTISCGMLGALLWACNAPSDSELSLPDVVSFNFDIRPILSDNCFVCHGPDSSSRQADLRLDTFEDATASLQNGHRAIVPGSSGKSEIIKRITATDGRDIMPPAEMNKQLSAREVELLKKWIDQGAQWEPYWAFIPVTPPQVPVIDNENFLENEIDNFLANELIKNGLEPSGKSDKSNLLRRLSYVLTGLPPGHQLQEDFAADESPQAYERVVDQLLSSPHFGEHWARHWMDLVRYADTRGHEFDYEIMGAWRYRDYLIRAFNQDVPYDQLVLEHLAGDLLVNPRLHQSEGFNESIIGTAFYCLGEGKHSPVDTRADEAERIDNIIDVTTKTFQGLTVGCAKCHDHKFDPIPTTDYYSLYGIIESTRFTMTPGGINSRKLELLDSIKSDLSEIKRFIGKQLVLSETAATSAIESNESAPEQVRILGDFREGGLQSWKSVGVAFTNALGTPIIHNDQLLGLENGKASSKVYGTGLQGALRSPTFTISQDSLRVRAAGKLSTVRVIVNNFQLIQNPIYGALRIHPEHEEMRDYSIDVSMWKGQKAYIELQVGNYGQKKGKDFHSYDIDPEAWLEVAYVYAFDSIASIPSYANNRPTSLSEAWNNWQIDGASATEITLLNQYFKRLRPTIFGVNKIKKEALRRSLALYDSIYLVGVTDGDAIQSPVFIRGNPKQLSSYKVPHRFFAAVSDSNEVFDEQGSGRLQFAQRVVDTNNPLTARVMTNRIWHHVFGKGLVETVDNFGLQGKPPTHPDLLDYLAHKFMIDGWSIKKMIRFMVLSQAFQRNTRSSKLAQELDPNNRLWHRYPVRRIEAESIRDAMLASSGQLDGSFYGPPVPIYLTEFLKGRGRPAKSGPLNGRGRRSIYQRVMRNFLPPMMLAFDMPVPFSTFGNRNVTNVPAQSLTLMNDPFVIDQAGHWAQKIIREDSLFDVRVKRIYETAFCRGPSSIELQQARDFFQIQKLLYKDRDSADLESALWQDYCHSIFSMKEFIYLI